MVKMGGFDVRAIFCGRYAPKVGPNPLLETLDWVANNLKIGGIVLYGRKPERVS
jgi:hypothetical protein